MVPLKMQLLTSAFISLPLSSRDARALGIHGGNAEEQAGELEAALKAKGFKCQVGDKGLSWMVDGFYIYVISESPRLAAEFHKYLEKLSARLADAIIVPTSWQVRPSEKHLDYPPRKEDLLSLTFL